MPFESNDTFVCTKDDPWSKEKHDGRTLHPDAESGEDRDFGGGEYCASWKCPNCGHHWYEELAQ